MRQLLLLRHAEAQAAHAECSDFERPLSAAGRIQVQSLAERLQAIGVQPTLLVLSPARRTCETAALLLEALGCEAPLQPEPALYLGGPEELLAVLRRCPDAAQILLVVGHNPGLSALARELTCHALAEDTADALRDSTWQLGAAGLCRLQLEGTSWRQLRPELVCRVWLEG